MAPLINYCFPLQKGPYCSGEVLSLWVYTHVKTMDEALELMERENLSLSHSGFAWNLRKCLLFWGKDVNGPKQGMIFSQWLGY